MKTASIHLLIRILLVIVALALLQSPLFSQPKQTIAIISLDTKDMELDNEAMANLVRLELEKIDKFEVLDKYDVQEVLSRNDVNTKDLFGKNAVLRAGTLLKTDKMLTGSVERFGDKIIFILRLVDVKSEKVERTSVMEYQNVQNEIQTMSMISLNELFGIPNDAHLVDLLINYNLPITTMKTTVNLNGPRMGATYTMGETGSRMRDSRQYGGYDMFAITSMFGYQFEKQYLSSGDFQALVESILSINGIESGKLIPAISFINGFRFNKSGIEFGLGPSFRLNQVAEGYFLEDKWIRTSEVEEIPEDVRVVERLDNRGDLKLSLGLIVAVGKTFKSGYLNVPVNLFLMPRKEGSAVGISFGFNTTNRPKL